MTADDRRIAGVAPLLDLAADYEELVLLFGEPDRVLEIPSQLRAEWRIAFSADQVAVIHERGAAGAALSQHRRWSLWGHHLGIATRVEALLATLRAARRSPVGAH